MKRLLPLVLLPVLLAPAQTTGAGCAPATCGVQSVALPDSPVLALRPFGDGGPFAAYDVRTGARRFELPYGVASANGRWFFTARNTIRVASRVTTLTRYDAHTGAAVRRWSLPQKLSLFAVSANGRHAALVHARSFGRHAKRTYFAVFDTPTRSLHRFSFRGRFDVEAISDDGRRLFVIQYLRRGYLVRVVDVRRAALRPGDLRPKNEDEEMRGFGMYAIGSPDGRWLLTLYVKRAEHEAFVHALDLDRAVAYCLDLPGRGNGDALSRYGLTLAPDGRTLYAASPELGSFAAMDLRTLEMRAVLRFRGKADTAQWTNAAVSPSGGLVYFGGLHRLWAYDVARRQVRGPYEIGLVGGFAFTPDGRRLTVIRPGGKALALDALTGHRVR